MARSGQLLRTNRELVANWDKEFEADTPGEEKINTVDYAPIKLKSYRIPFHKRPQLIETPRNMLVPGVIERSESP